MTIPTAPTTEQIEAAILAALAPTGDELVPWPPMRDRLAGCFCCQAEALLRRYWNGRVYIIGNGGRE